MLPAVGGIMLSIGSVDLYESIRCESWPQTDGIIRSATVESTSRPYHAKIFYYYTVRAVPFIGTRVAIRSDSGPEERVEAIVRKYSPGKAVRVLYSPTHPENAVLEPGVFIDTWYKLVLGGLFLAVGLAPLRFGYAEKSLV